MHYKGYTAFVRYSDDDKCLIGYLLGITDIVDFQATTITDARREFRVAVDSYLGDCREMGRAPDRPFHEQLRVTLPPSLYRTLAVRAGAEGRSVDDLIASTVSLSLAK